MHEAAGLEVPELRPATMRAAVNGWCNKDEEDGRKKRIRQAITLDHMELLKLLLRLNDLGWSLYHWRMLFTIACRKH